MLDNIKLKLSLIYTIIFNKGGAEMLVLFIASAIILEQYTYSRVPNKLKQKVKEILIEQCGEEFAAELMER